MKKIWNRYSYAIILIFLSLASAIIISQKSHDQDQYIKITVSEGDSLWEISQQYSERHSLTHNQFISWVEKHNNIDGGEIYPGEKIIIPVSKTSSAPAEYASGADR